MSGVWMTGRPASMQLVDSGGQTPMIVEISYETESLPPLQK